MKLRYSWFWVLVSGFILLISPAAGTTAPNKSVIAAGSHVLAVQKDGSLWAWGNNWYGQLGLGYTSASHALVRVGTAANWVAVAANLQRYDRLGGI
jgi:hypothetical protein